MFPKLALLAFVAPLVSALTLHIPDNIRTQEEVTFTWDTAPGDPEFFTLQLVNEEFNDSFAIANTIDSASGSITLTVPVVPVRGGYTLAAINVGNVLEVYATTGQFSVGALDASATPTSSRSSTTGVSASISSSSSRSVTSTTATTSPTRSISTPATSSTPAATTNNADANPAATNLSDASSLKYNVGLAIAAVAGVAVWAL